MNEPVYLNLSVLEMSKTVMYEFWYDQINRNYRNYITWIQTALYST